MPFFVNAMQAKQINPLFFFGILGLIGSFVIYYLRETYGKELKDFVTQLKDNERPLISFSNPRRSGGERFEDEQD